MSKERHWFEAVCAAGRQLSIQLRQGDRLVTGCYSGYSNGKEFKFQCCPIMLRKKQHTAQWVWSDQRAGEVLRTDLSCGPGWEAERASRVFLLHSNLVQSAQCSFSLENRKTKHHLGSVFRRVDIEKRTQRRLWWTHSTDALGRFLFDLISLNTSLSNSCRQTQ